MSCSLRRSSTSDPTSPIRVRDSSHFSFTQAPSVTPDVILEEHNTIKRTNDDGEKFGNKKPRRSLFQSTQPCTYTQDDQAAVEEECFGYYIQDTASKQFYSLLEHGVDELLIGRCNVMCHIVSNDSRVSQTHAKIKFDKNFAAFKLVPLPDKKCWIRYDGRWHAVDCTSDDNNTFLEDGDLFRLLYNTSNPLEKGSVGVEFRFTIQKIKASEDQCGGASFDLEYLKLLQALKQKGIEKKNVKGDNVTLPEQTTLRINLRSSDDKNLLPMTSLRYVYGGRPAIIEALWYLRGENHIKFLQELECKFWNKQAKEDGFVGLSYGLLTNYPDRDGRKYNQLELHVIEPLCANRSSRNMYCSLTNPHEPTVQQACSTGVQFAVTDEHLDITVNQRSSDVMLGLPNDVIIWATILHLVRLEVRQRSGRILKAGSLYFTIAAGGAHVYKLNIAEFDILRQRKPIVAKNPPELFIENDIGYNIFELAKNYRKPNMFINEKGVLPSLRIQNYLPEETHRTLTIKQAL